MALKEEMWEITIKRYTADATVPVKTEVCRLSFLRGEGYGLKDTSDAALTRRRVEAAGNAALNLARRIVGGLPTRPEEGGPPALKPKR